MTRKPKPKTKPATVGSRIAKKSTAEIEFIVDGLDEYLQRVTSGNLPHAIGSLRGALAAMVTLYKNGDKSMAAAIDAAVRKAVKKRDKQFEDMLTNIISEIPTSHVDERSVAIRARQRLSVLK